MPPPRHAYWRTKDGRKVEIKELEDNHLINILRMLKRKVVEAAKQHGRPDVAKNWRSYASTAGDQRLRFLEEEVRRRGLVWDSEEVSGIPNSDKFDDACVGCSLGLVCKTQELTARKCSKCSRAVVPMGGAIRTVFVPGSCPRILKRKYTLCHECKKKEDP
jgi:hypothetical protein